MSNSFKTQASSAGGFVFSVKNGATTTPIGFTKDIEYSDGVAYRTTTVMGRQVALKGEKEMENAEPFVNTNALQIEADTFILMFSGYDVVDNVGIKTLTRRIAIEDTDYHDEIIVTGKLKNGKTLTLVGKNALGDMPATIIIPESGDVIIPVGYKFHNLTQDETTLPIEITIDETV